MSRNFTAMNADGRSSGRYKSATPCGAAKKVFAVSQRSPITVRETTAGSARKSYSYVVERERDSRGRQRVTCRKSEGSYRQDDQRRAIQKATMHGLFKAFEADPNERTQTAYVNAFMQWIGKSHEVATYTPEQRVEYAKSFIAANGSVAAVSSAVSDVKSAVSDVKSAVSDVKSAVRGGKSAVRGAKLRFGRR